MLEWLNSLEPAYQAGLAGLVVSWVLYLIRYVAPKWMASEEHAAKAGKTLLAIALASWVALGVALANGSLVWGEFLAAWFAAWAASQGWHNLAKRI